MCASLSPFVAPLCVHAIMCVCVYAVSRWQHGGSTLLGGSHAENSLEPKGHCNSHKSTAGKWERVKKLFVANSIYLQFCPSQHSHVSLSLSKIHTLKKSYLWSKSSSSCLFVCPSSLFPIYRISDFLHLSNICVLSFCFLFLCDSLALYFNATLIILSPSAPPQTPPVPSQ